VRSKTINRFAYELALWLFSLVVLIPFFLVLVNSLKDRAGANLMNLSLPSVFHWENYPTVIREGRLVRSFFNSLLISTLSVAVSLVSSSLAAFVLSRRRSRMNKVIYYYFLLGLVAHLNMITVIRSLQVVQLMNTYAGIILLYGALLLPFSIFLYFGFVSTIPRSMDESALIDGCKPFRAFTQIIFPLLKPVTITVILINFMNAWNEFMLPLYVLNNSRKWTMTLAVYNFYGRRVSEWNLVYADVIVTIAPVIILYIVGQKYLVSGMTAGAVKG
jgi:raffinose/stachyose/melibiose transport system permease protein